MTFSREWWTQPGWKKERRKIRGGEKRGGGGGGGADIQSVAIGTTQAYTFFFPPPRKLVMDPFMLTRFVVAMVGQSDIKFVPGFGSAAHKLIVTVHTQHPASGR